MVSNAATKILTVIVMLAVVLATLTITGCRQGTESPNQQPIEVTSVTGPLPPINPGGPIVEIVLKNVSSQSTVRLSATLEAGGLFEFNFDVTPDNPLPPNQSRSARLILISGGFSDSAEYPLTITTTLKDDSRFVYTVPVRIAAPKS